MIKRLLLAAAFVVALQRRGKSVTAALQDAPRAGRSNDAFDSLQPE